MTTPPARGGQAKPVPPPAKVKGPDERYAALPIAARIGLRTIPPGRSVDMILDVNPPVLSGGGGGWQVTDRWGRVGFTSWQGCPPSMLTFVGVFDAKFSGDPDVEDSCTELQAMYAPRGDFSAPRHVTCVGGPHGTGPMTWVISDLVWQPEALRTADGARRIQAVEVTLLEFVDPDSVIRPTKVAASAAVRKRLYVVKAGDTLTSIAKNRLGDARLADDIRRENLPALADPRSLKKGMTILLPAGKLHKS
jgi:hypothetical protein